MVGEPTDSTVRWLFAKDWAARDDGKPQTMRVPGASVEGPNTAANLLSLAFHGLREQRLIELEQVGEPVADPVMVMGGRSAVQVTPLPGEALRMGGLEGALLTAARTADEGDRGVRELVLSLDLDDNSPWISVANHAREHARAAGLVELEGRMARTPVVADEAGAEALRPRNEEIAKARRRFAETEPELARALLSDCLAAILWAHTG